MRLSHTFSSIIGIRAALIGFGAAAQSRSSHLISLEQDKPSSTHTTLHPSTSSSRALEYQHYHQNASLTRTSSTHSHEETALRSPDVGKALFDNHSMGHYETRQSFDESTERPTITKHASLPTLNASSISKTFPEYVLPTSGNNGTEGCRAWGPLCQTGSTVVNVKDHHTTMMTTVPCSSFLSAQAYSIRHDKESLYSWRSHFGRSPECTAYAEDERRAKNGVKPDWFPSCGEMTDEMLEGDQYPPGIFEGGKLNQTVRCCGPCAIFVPKVNLLYFPEDPHLPCGADLAASTLTAAPNSQDRTSLFVTNGFTYTSPSLYFEIMGTASFMDDCGQLGTKVVSSTLAIPPGVMSTVTFDVPVGAILPRGERASKLRRLAALKTRDLACPTWGVDMPVATDSNQEVRIAHPFYPLLLPPPALLAIDTAWSKCYQNHWPLRFGIFDPPRALTANSVMVDSSTLVPTPQPTFSTGSTSAAPAAIPVTDAPKATPAITYSPQVSTEVSTSNVLDVASHDQESGESENEEVFTTQPTAVYKNLENALTDVHYQEFDSGETAHPAMAAAHAMIVGATTYTEEPDCSCYSLAPSKVLNPGRSLTMADGKVISLARDGATAVIDGSTQQLSPVITGVAPAFAGVLTKGQAAQTGSSSVGHETEKAASLQNIEGTATISANGLIMTAALETGNNDLLILGDAGGLLTTLTPGASGVTAANGEIISLGSSGILDLNGEPIASVSSSVTPTDNEKIGAAVATAFHIGSNEVGSQGTAATPNTSISTGNLSMAQPNQGCQIILLRPWAEVWIAAWSCFFLLLC